MGRDRGFLPDSTAQRACGFDSGAYRCSQRRVTSILVISVGGCALPPVGIRPCCLVLPCSSIPSLLATTFSMLTLPVGIPSNSQTLATPAATFASMPVPQPLLTFHEGVGTLLGESLGSPSCSPEGCSLMDQQVLVWLCSAVPRAFPHGLVAVAALRVIFPLETSWQEESSSVGGWRTRIPGNDEHGWDGSLAPG